MDGSSWGSATLYRGAASYEYGALGSVGGFLQHAVGDGFELVGSQQVLLFESLGLDGLQQGHALLLGGFDAELLTPALDRGRPAIFAEDDIDGLLPDELGREGHVFERMLLARHAHPAGDDAGFDFVETVAHDGTIRRLSDLGLLHDESRNFAEFLRANADIDAVQAEQGQDHVFHGHVAGALAQAGDGGLGDGSSGLQGGQRIGNAEPEVLMAVNFHGLLQPLDGFLYHMVNGIGGAAAHGVRESEGVHVALGGDFLDDVEQAIDFRAGGVNSEKHGVQARFFGGARGVNGGLHGAIKGPSIGVLDHVIAGGNLDNYALTSAGFDDLDLFGNAAGKGKNFRLQTERGDVLNGRFILIGNGRHSGLNEVDPERIKLPGEGHVLLPAEDHSSLLV